MNTKILTSLKKQADGDDSIIIIYSRTPEWVKRSGLIPGAVSIPFTQFKASESTREIMEDQFNVMVGDAFYFGNAKTLVMYCNGNWYAQ